jgi:Uma2 family endonuclease
MAGIVALGYHSRIMTLAAPQSRYTPDDVLRLEDQGLYELVDGKLVKKEMSSLASRSAVLISTQLENYVKTSKSLACVYAEPSFQCFAHDPELTRRPDVALIIASRLAAVPEEGHIPIAPDLAVEVISPNDKIYQFEEKLVDYQRAKIPLIWEVNPKFRFVRIHRLHRDAERLNESATLTADPVLPGFAVVVSELFPPVGSATP